MSDITTPYQKRSYTSIKAAAEKDKDGSTSRDCKILLAWMQQRKNAGEGGIYIFEAAAYLSQRQGVTIPPGTASARLSDLMSDKKCQKYFGCPALVEHGKERKLNPTTNKTAGIYVLKSDSGAENLPAKPSPVGHAAAASEGSGGGGGTNGPRATPAVTPGGNPHEGPDAYRTELLESAAGRRVASDVRAGRAPQLDFGFTRQLPSVKL